MFPDFISKIFRNVEPELLQTELELPPQKDERDSEDVEMDPAKIRTNELNSSLEYYYLDHFVSLLPRTAKYKIQEQVRSGEIITHEIQCSYEHMAWYVRTIFLPNHPPKLIVTAL